MTQRSLLPALSAPLALAIAACATPSQQTAPPLASAALITPTGENAGTATIGLAKGRPTLTIAARHLAPGPHGVHLHAVGKCDAPGFTSAGSHLNPGNRQHGTENPAGAHFGDLPNLVAAASGEGALNALLAGDAQAVSGHLFDGDGTAIVIHAAADDYRTDPSGNSGARIACGVFLRP